MKLFLLIFLFVLSSFTQIGYACFAPQLHTRTLFLTLPDAAQLQPVVAKISIQEPLTFKKTKIIKAKILEPIKGVKKSETISVKIPQHNCAREQKGNINAGDIYYIAGKFNSFGVFEGEWRGRKDFPQPLKKVIP